MADYFILFDFILLIIVWYYFGVWRQINDYLLFIIKKIANFAEFCFHILISPTNFITLLEILWLFVLYQISVKQTFSIVGCHQSSQYIS